MYLGKLPKKFEKHVLSEMKDEFSFHSFINNLTVFAKLDENGVAILGKNKELLMEFFVGNSADSIVMQGGYPGVLDDWKVPEQGQLVNIDEWWQKLLSDADEK